MSNVGWLLSAALIQGLLTLGLLALLSFVRVRLLGSGQVKAQDVVLYRDAWPDHAKQVSNAFDNQFQLPVLFYAAVALSLHFGPTLIEVGLAWTFAASRWFHAGFYVTKNNVPRRATAFSVGFAALIVWWVDLAVRLPSAL